MTEKNTRKKQEKQNTQSAKKLAENAKNSPYLYKQTIQNTPEVPEQNIQILRLKGVNNTKNIVRSKPYKKSSHPNLCSMKISQDVRDYVAEKGDGEADEKAG